MNILSMFKTPRVFLDYASTTPVDAKVFKVMKPYWGSSFYNPSAIYEEGVYAKKAIESARIEAARCFSVQSREIIFTSGGTESANLALLGVFENLKQNWTREKPPHVVVSTIEHPAVLEAAREIVRRGGTMSVVPVNEKGLVSVHDVLEVLTDETVVVSVMYANNEIGTIQPIRDIGHALKKYRDERTSKNNFLPLYFHTDASQAFNYLDCTVSMLNADLLTVDGSKVYGPKGVGILVVRGDISLAPITYGGGQERGIRSGTENAPLVVGLARALSISEGLRKSESFRLRKLRDYCVDSLTKQISGITINGDLNKRLPNNVNICIPHIDAEFAIIKLDRVGIAASTASSCSSLAPDSRSYVIEALGKGRECATSSLRFTFGRSTTKKDIDILLKKLPLILQSFK